MNKNAYAQVALNGTNFCTSAINGFLLILKNTATFAITSGLGSVFIFLGKVAITVGNTCIGYVIIAKWPRIYDQINSPVAPLIVIFIISYILASLFMSIFAVAATSLLQCFLVDVELSKHAGKGDADGTHRPKEMEYLVKILRKQ